VRRTSASVDLGIILRTPFALLRQMHRGFRQNHCKTREPALKATQETALSGYSTQRLG
jgi:hypothetical protein